MKYSIILSLLLQTLPAPQTESSNVQQQVHSQTLVFKRQFITYGTHGRTSTKLIDVAENGIATIRRNDGVTEVHEYRDTELRLSFGERITPPTNRQPTQITWMLDPVYALIPPGDGLGNQLVPYMAELPFEKFLVPRGHSQTGTWNGVLRLQTKNSELKLDGIWTYTGKKSDGRYIYVGPFRAKDANGNINISGSFERVIDASTGRYLSSSGQLLIAIKPAMYPVADGITSVKYRQQLESLKKFDKILVHSSFRMLPYIHGEKSPIKLSKAIKKIIEKRKQESWRKKVSGTLNEPQR